VFVTASHFLGQGWSLPSLGRLLGVAMVEVNDSDSQNYKALTHRAYTIKHFTFTII
jgi:hypothetical protein